MKIFLFIATLISSLPLLGAAEKKPLLQVGPYTLMAASSPEEAAALLLHHAKKGATPLMFADLKPTKSTPADTAKILDALNQSSSIAYLETARQNKEKIRLYYQQNPGQLIYNDSFMTSVKQALKLNAELNKLEKPQSSCFTHQ